MELCAVPGFPVLPPLEGRRAPLGRWLTLGQGQRSCRRPTWGSFLDGEVRDNSEKEGACHKTQGPAKRGPTGQIQQFEHYNNESIGEIRDVCICVCTLLSLHVWCVRTHTGGSEGWEASQQGGEEGE